MTRSAGRPNPEHPLASCRRRPLTPWKRGFSDRGGEDPPSSETKQEEDKLMEGLHKRGEAPDRGEGRHADRPQPRIDWTCRQVRQETESPDATHRWIQQQQHEPTLGLSSPLGPLASLQAHQSVPQSLSHEPCSPLVVPAAGSFEDLDLVGPSSHYKEETLPLETPDPLETRLCPTCGKTCS